MSEIEKNGDILFGKKEIIQILMSEYGYKYKEAKKITSLILKIFTDALQANKTIFLREFGSFKVYDREGYTYFSHVAGQEYEIPARKVVRFRPFLKLLRALNKD